ncbi:hypothetical protein AD929_12185 [Gluconobacter potus]|uniref:Uncharacterized protein n=1 Tax=Gluconobacter potus TaxID=2724927 RepID=A0A149QS25_9PROT|nr:response regulator [Gluconobacter potus]KXU99983.1 hypothetical protein AD929_12185 [Gluconobacter potus]
MTQQVQDQKTEHPPRGRRVLIVDDRRSMGHVLAALLASRGRDMVLATVVPSSKDGVSNVKGVTGGEGDDRPAPFSQMPREAGA